jgi:hypothetical protein
MKKARGGLKNLYEKAHAHEQGLFVGGGCDCLIPDRPPKEALDRRRKQANEALREQRQGDHIRSRPGYRPHRKSSARRRRD